MTETQLLVVGAGPYGLSAAAAARAAGIETEILGRPMAFWRDHMPAGMFLRSGPDWHLDADGEHTLERYLREQGIDLADVDPIPIDVFLGYADWFQARKGLAVREEYVERLDHNGRFEATLESGERIRAQAVVAAPGIRHFAHRPDWAAALPDELSTHTCDLVAFDALAGARVLIVGGRQSAYEWAALLAEAGAERVDVVHRHAEPRFDHVSWAFADAHVESTVAERGWWRSLDDAERERIARRFWEVGRLTLEHWLVPRLDPERVRRRAHTDVVDVAPGADTVRAVLSDGDELTVDRVVFACGYKADLARVPYLRALAPEIEQRDGFPVLDEAFGSSLPGLYFPGFLATRDFGPFFGFVRGVPASTTLIVRDLRARLG